MVYSAVFGGATIYPSDQTYLSLAFSTDQALAWPIEQQLGGSIAADIIDLNASVGSLNVDFADAKQVSNGFATVFNNVGANTVTIRDADGGTILSIANGTVWITYLADNSTTAGVWRTFQMGAATSTANAAGLAGAGLKAVSATLNQNLVPSTSGSSPVTIVDTDRAKAFIWTGGAGTLNLPTAGTVGSDWFFSVRNSGSGDLTITPPAGTIDGGGTLALSTTESAIIFTDGVNFFTIGLGKSTTSTFDFLSIAAPGTGDYTLSGSELNRISYEFTGILTGNRNIVVPASIQEYWVDNQTTGAFTLSVNVAAQPTPVVITQGDRNILYCDGTEVLNANSSTVVFPIAISQGGTGATTAGAARTALGVPPDSRDIIAGTGLTGGGDLTSDRTINVGAGTGIDANANDVALNTANARNVDHSGVSVTAGAGLTGGGTIAATRTINVGAGTGITVNANDVALDTAHSRNDDHDAISVAAGTGLTGGGTIAATRTVNLDISSLTNMDIAGVSATDSVLVNDGGVMKQMDWRDMGSDIVNSATQTLTLSDANRIHVNTGTGLDSITVPPNSSVAFNIGAEFAFTTQNTGNTLLIEGSGVTINSLNGNLRIKASGGGAYLVKTSTNVWSLIGDLEA